VNRISYEARRLLRELFDYADERRTKGEYDVTKITEEYYRNELRPYFEENGNKASLFLRKFLTMTKHFVDTDPRYQSRLDDFAKTVKKVNR
jgi:hypothetical protein